MEKRLAERIMEVSPVGIVLVDSQGHITLANTQAERILGLTKTDLAQRHYDAGEWDITAFDGGPFAVEDLPVSRVLATGQAVTGVRHAIHRSDGSHMLLSVNATPLRGESGDIEAVVAVFEDVTERIRTEQALEQKAALLSRAEAVAHIGSWRLVLEGGRLTWSDEMYRIFGLDRETFTHEVNDVVRLAVHPDDRDVMDAVNAAVLLDGIPRPMEYRIVQLDGTVRWVFAQGVQEEDAGGRVVALSGFVQDITDRRLAVEALEDERANLEAIFLSSPIGMLVLDQEGRIVRANPAALALAGTDPADIVGRGPGDVLRCTSGSTDPRGCGFSAECPLCPLRAGLESVVGGGSLRGVEVPLMLQRQDGVRQAWIRVGAEPLALIDGQHHVILTLDDVTERRWAKEALRQSENELRTLIEAAPVAIIRLDRRARVELWNRAAEQIYGWTEAEVLGKALPILTTDDGAFDNGMFRRLHRGEPVSSVEIRNVRRDGTMIRAVLSAAPIFDASGEVIGSMGILRDVTEERETEERLRQSQKMEAVGQLAGGVAHDFNNLLTVIGGCCELLAMDSGLGDSSALELAEIRAAVDRASRLTHQILAFSRRQPLQPRVCSVNTLVEGVAPLLRRTLGEDVHLVVGLDERVSPTEVDPHQFEQVLLNLAVNSRVAMPNGGMLTIMTDDVELSDDYRATHPWIPPGRYVRVAVSDTGVGMDTETMSHAFEPFFTTKAPGAGTGLGLSTVYGIVQQSGGHVTLESEPGVGTTATVFLPIVTSVPSVVPEVPEATPQDDVLGHETIVVVEDEEPLRTLVARILRKSGYTVHTAPDAERGLALLGDPDLHVDLLLTDVVLTGSVQGGELGRRAQELRPGMTVLYMSGYPRGIGDRVPEGVNFLSKPFTPEVLAREVRAVLEGAAEMSGGGP